MVYDGGCNEKLEQFLSNWIACTYIIVIIIIGLIIYRFSIDLPVMAWIRMQQMFLNNSSNNRQPTANYNNKSSKYTIKIVSSK